MRRPRLRRKRLSKAKAGAKPAKPRAPKPGAAKPKPAAAKKAQPAAAAAKASRKPKLPRDVRFRTTTRFKAVGYGFREQAWRLTRAWDKLEGGLRRLWGGRSPGTRRRILAALGVVALYLLIKFVPVPGVPCEISAAKECAPGDAAVSLVPADALAYAHVTFDQGSAQYDRAASVLGLIPRLDQGVVDLVRGPTSVPLSFQADIRPWAANDGALAILPVKGGHETVVLISIRDSNGAAAFSKKVAPPGGRLTTATNRGFLVVGPAAAVHAVVATGSAKGKTRPKTLQDDPVASGIRDGLPANRLADIYLSARGVQTLLAGSTAAAAVQLETFVDYSASRGFAAAAVARDQGIEFDLVSSLDPAKERKSPSFFSNLPQFQPNLTHFVGSRAMAYIGIGDAGATLGALLKRASSAQPALAQALSGFIQRLQAEARVNPANDLLPALGGQAALVAEPTDGYPFASVIVDGVNEKQARDAMARLQGPILRAISSSPAQKLPNFTQTTIDGVQANELAVSPVVTLTYAVFDGKLVISTQPAGIAQVKSGGGQRLTDASVFTDATGPLPDQVSALVFFNLDELLNLAERLGRVSDPLYASLRDDIRKLHAIAVGVNAGGHELRSRLFVTIK